MILQDTYVPFFATATEKLEAVAEADGNTSPDEPEPIAKKGQETKDKDVQDATAETSPSESETATASRLEGGEKPKAASESIAPAGNTVEGPDASTVEPMSQEESLGGIDVLKEGVKEPMSQEEAASMLECEPMSQSAVEHLEQGAKKPMSQEETASEFEGEPMSQSTPEHLEEAEALTPAETASAPGEDDVLGRKRSA